MAVKESREVVIEATPAEILDVIADVVVFLASDEARYLHGAVVPVDGGITARA